MGWIPLARAYRIIMVVVRLHCLLLWPSTRPVYTVPRKLVSVGVVLYLFFFLLLRKSGFFRGFSNFGSLRVTPSSSSSGLLKKFQTYDFAVDGWMNHSHTTPPVHHPFKTPYDSVLGSLWIVHTWVLGHVIGFWIALSDVSLSHWSRGRALYRIIFSLLSFSFQFLLT